MDSMLQAKPYKSNCSIKLVFPNLRYIKLMVGSIKYKTSTPKGYNYHPSFFGGGGGGRTITRWEGSVMK